jgi:class 3 adenylate cyclase
MYAQTFLFADLAGFTALTEAHGDEQAADLVAEFSREAASLLPRHAGEQVKAIGDALMLRVPGAGEAIRLGLELTGEMMPNHGYPAIRVGMHYGPALRRGRDWFGATVNLAARISALAGGGEVLLSESTRDAAGSLDGVQLQDRGTRRLRNISQPVRLFAAVSPDRPRDEVPIDPVCRMAVDPNRCAGSLMHEGVRYHFCSLECAARFAASPEAYLSGA